VILPADPKSGFLAHQSEVEEAVLRVLRSGWYILGKEVEGFEEAFAQYHGAGHAIGVGSGTDAIQIALRACNLSTGDRVATVSHTATATVAAIEMSGLIPVLVDIDPDTFTIDPDHLESLTKSDGGVKAVVVVHLYGQPAAMHDIQSLAKRYGLKIVEDCAQAQGAKIGDKAVGIWGDVSAFSFYPTKNLGALGDGGAVLTNNEDIGDRARLLREYGWVERYVSHFSGVNSRLDEIQAAILAVKLRHLDEENARRVELAKTYDEALTDTSLTLPSSVEGTDHVYHQYVVRAEDRDELQAYLGEREIGSLIHYPVPVHRQPAYTCLASGPEGLRNTDRVCQEILSLPMHPQLSKESLDVTISAILEWDRR